ncbi:MAG TPA: radical SAM protein, partial [Bacteroidales bacterium]|nr:radical SAM protein [Bacteroidales bacterium]
MLWESIAFGPIRSRRLGSSLGINLLPIVKKICSFDCVYCECGWTLDSSMDTSGFFSLEEVNQAIESKLIQCQQDNIPIDSITFSGNGEPTLHP